MKRRTLLGLGATLGGAAMIGTNAFSSVRAERAIEVEVVGDRNAFLALEPCDGDTEDDELGPSDGSGNDDPGNNNVPQASDFVYETSDGTIVIDLTAVDDDDEEDKREGVTGEGITEDSLWRFPNAFRITNQGTQNVAVDLKLEDDDGAVPTVDSGGEINGNEIDEDDPAVVFYKESDSDDRFNSDELNPDANGAVQLEPGNSVCIGFDIRTLGLEEDDLGGLTLRIRADARDESESSAGGDLRNDLVFGEPKGNGNNQKIRKLSGGSEVTNPTGNEGNIKALGPPAYLSDGGLVAPFLKNKNKIETTGDEEFKELDPEATDKPTLLAVGQFDGSPASIFYAGKNGGIYRVSGGEDENPVLDSDDTDAKAVAVAGIGDIDGDGADELVFVDTDKNVKYLTEDKKLKETGIGIRSTNSIGRPAVFEDGVKIPIVNDDGVIELIEPDDDDGFETVSVTGENEAAQAPLTAIDIDGDGGLEIVYVDESEDNEDAQVNSGNNPKLKFIDNPLDENPEIKTVKDDEKEDISASSNTGVA